MRRRNISIIHKLGDLVLYHGTNITRLPGILEDGLEPDRWRVAEDDPAGIYLTTDPKYAGMYAFGSGAMYGLENYDDLGVILEVIVPPSWVSRSAVTLEWVGSGLKSQAGRAIFSRDWYIPERDLREMASYIVSKAGIDAEDLAIEYTVDRAIPSERILPYKYVDAGVDIDADEDDIKEALMAVKELEG